MDHPPQGYGEDQTTQAHWNRDLTQLIVDHYEKGTVGGFIMSWVDEYWKAWVPGAVKGCSPIFGQSGFEESKCDWKAHVDCPHSDASSQSLCGYWLASTFDSYVNEAWYGINRVKLSKTKGLDELEQRLIYFELQKLFEGKSRPSRNLLNRISAWTLAISFLLISVSSGLYRERFISRVSAQHQDLPSVQF